MSIQKRGGEMQTKSNLCIWAKKKRDTRYNKGNRSNEGKKWHLTQKLFCEEKRAEFAEKITVNPLHRIRSEHRGQAPQKGKNSLPQ